MLAKSDIGIFLGYSTHSKAYWVYNKRNLVIEEIIYVVFDETPTTNDLVVEKDLSDDDAITLENEIEKLSMEYQPSTSM